MSGIGFNNGVEAKIGNSLFEQGCVVLKSANSGIAVRTQQGADFAGSVAVVNGQMDSSAIALTAGRLVTDSTGAVLCGEHGVVIVDGNSMPSYGTTAVQLFFGEFIFKQLFHIWKGLEIEDKFARHMVFSRMLIARVKMYVHSSISELLSAISTWFEFPATGAKTDSAAKRIELRLIGMLAIFNTDFALPLSTIRTGWMRVKIAFEFYILASRTKLLVIAYRRHTVANLIPVSAQFARHGSLSAEAALSGSFA